MQKQLETEAEEDEEIYEKMACLGSDPPRGGLGYRCVYSYISPPRCLREVVIFGHRLVIDRVEATD